MVKINDSIYNEFTTHTNNENILRATTELIQDRLTDDFTDFAIVVYMVDGTILTTHDIIYIINHKICIDKSTIEINKGITSIEAIQIDIDYIDEIHYL